MTTTRARRRARFCAAVCAGLLAWFIGKALHVPVWRDWDIGDRTDMVLVAIAGVWFLVSAIAGDLSDPESPDQCDPT